MNIFEFKILADNLLGTPEELGLPTTTATDARLKSILYFVFGLIAAISFLMIVVGGFRYVISIGDPQKITTARKTITYSLVGLVISLSAIGIVSFVIGKV